MTEKTASALEHEDGAEMPPLYGGVEFAEHVSAAGDVFHLCRDDGGGLVLLVDDAVAGRMDEGAVRWMASQFMSALEYWPQRG